MTKEKAKVVKEARRKGGKSSSQKKVEIANVKVEIANAKVDF